jgi:PAS domain S-box-containing protein
MSSIELPDEIVARLEALSGRSGQSAAELLAGWLTRAESGLMAAPDISDQLEALHRFRCAVEQSPLTIIMTDTQGHITYANPHFSQLTGYTLEEVLGQNPRILKSGHMSQEEYARLWQTILAGQEWRGEFLNKKKDGSLYWEAASISPIIDDRGTITHFLAIKEDITSRKQAEQALRERDMRYQALFERTNDAVIMIGLDYRIVQANQPTARLLGCALEDISGRLIADFLPPEEQRQALRVAQRLLAGEVLPLYEYRFRRKDGSIIQVEVNSALVYDTEGQPGYFYNIVRDISERKRMEQALRESEERFRAMISTIPDLILRIRSDNLIVEYIPVDENNLAPLPEPLPLSYALQPEAAAALTAATMQALQTQEMQVCEYAIHHAPDLMVYEEARIVQDGPDTVLAIIRDISDRKRMEAALKQREQTALEFQEHLKRLQEITIILARAATEEELCHKAVTLGAQRLGFDRLMLTLVDGLTIRTAYGVDQYGQVRDKQAVPLQKTYFDACRSALHENALIWHDVDLRDFGQVVGHGWYAMCCAHYGEQVLGALSIDSLLSQQPPRPYELELLTLYGTTIGHLIARKRAEEILRASEQRFRTLLEAAPVGILLVNREGRLVSANQRIAALFGYDDSVMNGMLLTDLMPERNRAAHRLHLSYFFAQPWQRPPHMALGLEIQGLRRDGSLFPLEVALSFIEIDGGMLAIGFVTDITERKQAEQHRLDLMLERERTAITAQFIRDATHEFRTPLSVINTDLYLLSRVKDRARQEELRRQIQQQTDQIAALIEALTTLVRLDYEGCEKMHTLDFSGLLHGVLAHYREAASAQQLTLETSIQPGPLWVVGSPNDLMLALTCLLDNALRYTLAGGRIRVTVETDDDMLSIAVQDSGIGMTEAVLARIFDRFYRADEAHTTRGFGLGLPIARRIVEYHQGRIDVRSQPHGGSTFTLRLPLAEQPLPADAR